MFIDSLEDRRHLSFSFNAATVDIPANLQGGRGTQLFLRTAPWTVPPGFDRNVLYRDPGSTLLEALVRKESGGDARAHNLATDAVGLLQITPGFLREVNAICNDRYKQWNSKTKDWQYDERYTTYRLQDRWNSADNINMGVIYMRRYGLDYQLLMGTPVSDVAYAAMFHSGARGYQTAEGKAYGAEIDRIMRDDLGYVPTQNVHIHKSGELFNGF